LEIEDEEYCSIYDKNNEKVNKRNKIKFDKFYIENNNFCIESKVTKKLQISSMEISCVSTKPNKLFVLQNNECFSVFKKLKENIQLKLSHGKDIEYLGKNKQYVFENIHVNSLSYINKEFKTNLQVNNSQEKIVDKPIVENIDHHFGVLEIDKEVKESLENDIINLENKLSKTNDKNMKKKLKKKIRKIKNSLVQLENDVKLEKELLKKQMVDDMDELDDDDELFNKSEYDKEAALLKELCLSNFEKFRNGKVRCKLKNGSYLRNVYLDKLGYGTLLQVVDVAFEN